MGATYLLSRVYASCKRVWAPSVTPASAVASDYGSKAAPAARGLAHNWSQRPDPTRGQIRQAGVVGRACGSLRK